MSFEKIIKARWNNPETGRFEVLEMKAKDIVANPTRHEFEAIVAALCACTSELVRREDERNDRLKNLLTQRTEVDFQTKGMEN